MITPIRKIFTSLFALAFLLLLLSGAGGASAKESSPAQITIRAAQDTFGAGQPVVVEVTITNPGKNTIKVLKWFTPAETVEEPLFNVSVDGAQARYLGPTYKRPDPKSEDYVALKAGESLTRSVTLSAYYDFSAGGSYSVRYDTAALDLFADEKGSKSAGSLLSNEISLKVTGRPAPEPPVVPPDAVSGSTTFNKCTASQQTTLLNARNQAKAYAGNALNYLTANTTGSRYVTWFGVLDAARYETARAHFSAIYSAVDSAPVQFTCGCKQRVYAYVYAGQPYNITVCSVFWQAPMTGTDSKAGTLIHEISHFYVVASTRDYVYGQSGAMSLALSSPDQAIGNADNHEYFAENTPALP